MSQRRMTSLEVINTDAFLDMPQSSQLLYFHLNARADDDGFVSNPKSIMRNSGAQNDDVKLLIAKKFIISFEDGVVVIKHWRINNYIRKDIYKETKYLDHKNTLLIRCNGAYTLTADGRAFPVPSGHFNIEDLKLENPLLEPQNLVHEASTKRALSIGKVSIGKVSIDNIKNMEQELTYDYSFEDKKKRKFIKVDEATNKTFIAVGCLWVNMVMKQLDLKQEDVPIKNLVLVIRRLWEREKWNYEDYKKLFAYFFNSKLPDEDKISFDLCMSQKYVAKYKIVQKKKPKLLSDVSGIKL